MSYNIGMFAKEEYTAICSELAGKAVLCAVSKQHSVQDIQTAYGLGQRIFAENKAQELARKAALLPADIEWHFIGHLQRNKVRHIMPYVSCIQSLDSLRLAETIEAEAARVNKTISCLLELHLAETDTNKTGLSKEEAAPLLEDCLSMPHLRIEGIMVMGPHTEDAALIHSVFRQARQIFLELQRRFPSIQILSMGMSDDYKTAVEEGSNMVRIGSRLFRED